MQFTKTQLVPVIICVALLLFSCANQKADYEEVQKLQDAAEQVIQRSADYDTRIKSCDYAINSLQRFLDKHKEGEWKNVAKNALSTWQARKASFEQELTSLSELLYSQLKERAIQESKKVHPASKVDSISLVNRTKSKEGNTTKVSDTYFVRMGGIIVGTHIFKLFVRVSGGIAMDSKRVFVDESASVEE